MIILLIMAMGIGIGWFVFPDKWKPINEKMQLTSILVLIFCMGVSLGDNPYFFEDLVQVGIKSLLFAVLPIVGSIGVVYFLTEKYLGEKNND